MTITVTNADSEADSTVEILVQNRLNYTPKVSVIMPVYNVEEYLRDSLDSVLCQSLKEIELICVDDGSTDSSLDILKEYAARDERITITTQQNSGSGKARNCGISCSKGEFIAFMDSDDMYPSELTLKLMYDAAVKHQVLICGGSLNQLKNGQLVTDPTKFEPGYTFNEDGLMQYTDYQFDYGYWRFIYNAKFIKDNHLHFPDYLRQQDPPFFIKTMALAGEFYALKEATYVYRASHKQIQWTERKALDMFRGVMDSLKYSAQYKLYSLHKNIAWRLNAWTFRTAAAEMIGNRKVRNQIIETLSAVNNDALGEDKEKFQLDDVYKAIIQAKDNNVIVSIIVPVYNVEKYLARCLDSLIAQSFYDIEILCINDGSTDGSLAILEEYAQKDDRIRIITKKNGGLSSARNVGIENARGAYICFIDSDDWIEPSTAEKCAIKMSGEVDLVCFGTELVNGGMNDNLFATLIQGGYHKIKLIGQKTISEDVILKSTYTATNKLFKIELIKKYSIRFMEGRLFEDDNFTIMYMVHCRSAYYLDEYFYHYIQRPNSIMERVRNCESDRTIDNFYIFDKTYQHCIKYGLGKRFSRVLSARYLTHLRSAFRFAPDYNKEKVRNLAYSFSKKYKECYVNTPVLTDLKQRNFSKIRELNDVIISLTSYPARINTVHQTIETLLNQSMRADKVILWLAPEQFPNKEADLPEQLLVLKQKGLIIDWYHDIKSYKKLIPALYKYPKAIIVTADDDLLYDREWLSKLFKAYQTDQETIWCHRAHKIRLDDNGIILPYKQWNFSVSHNIPSVRNFCTSGGGVLYPPHTFYKDITDEKKFMTLTPNADDIWFWAMCILNGKKINIVNNNSPLTIINGTQETALWHDNVNNNQNDVQLYNIIGQYPKLKKLLRKQEGHVFNLISYLLFPYFILKIKQYKAQISKLVVKNLASMRIDIKNYGSVQNTVSIKADGATITQAKWIKDAQGDGRIVESKRSKQTLYIRVIKPGKLVMHFRGCDRTYKGKRFPVWVDYTSIKVDGKEILSKPAITWHDKSFCYEMPVKDKQIIIIDIIQTYHQYSKEELHNILCKQYPNTSYIHSNIKEIVNNVHYELVTSGRRFKYFLFHKEKNNRQKSYYICGIRVWRNRVSIHSYLDARITTLAKLQAKQMQELQNAILKHINAQISQIKSAVTTQKNELFGKFDTIAPQISEFRNIVDIQNIALNHKLDTHLSQLIAMSGLHTEQMQLVSSDMLAHKNDIVNLVNHQVDALKAANDKVNLATQNMLTDAIKGVATLMQHQEQFASKLDVSQNDQENRIQSLNSSLTQEIKNNTKSIIDSVEKDRIFYYNPFEVRTRMERGLCDIVEAPDFENRFRKLIANLPTESARAIVDIVCRLKLIKDSKGKLDLFSPHEKDTLKELSAYYKSVLKISDTLYCLNNYLLPIKHFEPSVFFYKHGLDTLKHPERFANKAILDVGAFVGDSAIILSPLTTDKVYSFEATTENYNYMLKTIELNNLKNIVPIKAAVGAEKSTIELRVEGSCTSSSPLMVKEPQYIETCEVIKIDDYVKEHKLDVGLIKVDIEGAEQEFLKGAMQTIREQRPTLLISIYHNIDDFLDIKPLIESWNLGYTFSIFKPVLNNISGETLLICEQIHN